MVYLRDDDGSVRRVEVLHADPSREPGAEFIPEVPRITPALSVELYAITLEGPPPNVAQIDPEALRAASTLVATEQVRRPLLHPLPYPSAG